MISQHFANFVEFKCCAINWGNCLQIWNWVITVFGPRSPTPGLCCKWTRWVHNILVSEIDCKICCLKNGSKLWTNFQFSQPLIILDSKCESRWHLCASVSKATLILLSRRRMEEAPNNLQLFSCQSTALSDAMSGARRKASDAIFSNCCSESKSTTCGTRVLMGIIYIHHPSPTYRQE